MSNLIRAERVALELHRAADGTLDELDDVRRTSASYLKARLLEQERLLIRVLFAQVADEYNQSLYMTVGDTVVAVVVFNWANPDGKLIWQKSANMSKREVEERYSTLEPFILEDARKSAKKNRRPIGFEESGAEGGVVVLSGNMTSKFSYDVAVVVENQIVADVRFTPLNQTGLVHWRYTTRDAEGRDTEQRLGGRAEEILSVAQAYFRDIQPFPKLAPNPWVRPRPKPKEGLPSRLDPPVKSRAEKVRPAVEEPSEEIEEEVPGEPEVPPPKELQPPPENVPERPPTPQELQPPPLENFLEPPPGEENDDDGELDGQAEQLEQAASFPGSGLTTSKGKPAAKKRRK